MVNKKLNVTRKEYEDSYHRHYKMYQNTSDSEKTRRLILFYSVECGLKSLIMKNTGNNTYEELEDCYSNTAKKNLLGHDIKAMVKEINPANEFNLKNIQLAKGGGSVQPKKFNELWRYGAEVADEEEEINAEKTLVKIADWIKARI